MTKALLIGNGAREHAIAEALVKSSKLCSFMAANNPGIVGLSEKVKISSLNDFDALKTFVNEVQPDFAVIGPEAPLDMGVVDFLEELKIPAVGPHRVLARLETSKAFTRDMMAKYSVPGAPRFRVFKDLTETREFIEELEGFVIKPDGLTGGKGVMVQGDHLDTVEEAVDYCKEVLKDHQYVVVEEKLIGEEFSLQCITDGKSVKITPPAQDHKRAFVDDKGPNCYSYDTEILTEKGWKTFDKLKKDEKVMTYNSKNKILKYEKPKKKYWMKHNGKMIHFKHRELDLLVTPNHRMLVKHRKTNKIKVLKAENVIGENEIFLSGIWKGKSQKYFFIEEFDYKFNRKLKKQKIKFIDWIQFMGLFLSEGYIVDTKKEHRIYICQTKRSKYFEDFKKILSKLPFTYSYEEKHHKFRINSIQLTKILKKYGTSRKKYIPDYIKNTKKENILKFLKAFMMGDGSIHSGRMRFHSGSKKLIGDIQELVLKIEKSGIITIDKRNKMLNPINKKYYKANNVYSLEIKPEAKVGIRKNNISKIDYKGYVGCVTVSTGFIIVRRNNRVAISGNTGGMGSYSCEDHLLPFITDEHVQQAREITELMAEALYKETGVRYKGIMYGGFIATKNGVKLIEYNARFGDPEAMNVLTIMKTDFTKVCTAVVEERLDDLELEFEDKATVCKYAVPEGYPSNPVKNVKIEVGDSSARVYYAAVDQRDDGLYMTGSRAVAFVGIGDTIDEAEKIAQEAVSNVKGPVFFREDIGTEKLLNKRVENMKRLM